MASTAAARLLLCRHDTSSGRVAHRNLGQVWRVSFSRRSARLLAVDALSSSSSSWTARSSTGCGGGHTSALRGNALAAVTRTTAENEQHRGTTFMCSAAADTIGGGASFAGDAEGNGGKAGSGVLPAIASAANAVRAVAFYLTTLLIAVPLFLAMLLLHPFVLLFDPVRRRAQHAVNNIWANTTTSLFYRTEVEGTDNLPNPDEAAVFVANHQSQLDIYTLFQLRRPFKFISKTSNFLIPIVGWSMYLTGHVPLRREDKRSQMECLKECISLLKAGSSVLFFPEGTRTRDGKLGPFKKGAFSVAVKAGVPVVPITLLGTGMLMPNGEEGTLHNPSELTAKLGMPAARVIIHPPLTSSDADELCSQARAVIAGTLLDNGFEVRGAAAA